MSAFGKHSICRAVARALAVAALALASFPGMPVSAASLIAPRNYGELARAADAVVFARARASIPAARGQLVFTSTEFEVLSSYSGPAVPGDVITVETPGGELESRAWFVPGSPDFFEDENYLLCLSRKSEDLWIPAMLFYGVLVETTAAAGRELLSPIDEHPAGLLPRPDGLEVEPPGPFDKAAFLNYLPALLGAGAEWSSEGLGPGPVSGGDGGGAEQPEGCSIFSDNGRKMRWRRFDTGDWATIYGNSAGDSSVRDGGFWIVQQAMELWMEIPGTSCNLYFGGSRDPGIDCARSQGAESNFILFGDPCSDIADIEGCGGVLAYGGPITTSTHSFDGESWLTITGWFVVVNEGVGCLGTTGYRNMMAHELGHGLGYGHVDDSRALMYASCCRGINETDRTCSTYAYPALDEANERPRALAGADMDLVLLGDTVRLRATVSDDGLPVDRELETTWAVISGPGEVVFADPGAPSTTASFSESGQYILSLVAHDGELLHVDQVEINVEILIGSKARESFRQGSDGYSAAVDTYVGAASPAEAHGADQALRIDSDFPGGSGSAAQGLLRFGDIFGPQPGQLPPGVEIERAWLELETTNAGDGAAIYRMLQPWSELSVWSDFGGDGIQPGVESVSALQADVVGVGGTVEVDVTDSLAAWSLDPSSNNGWAFLPVGSDGWQFASSDSGASAPKLLVEYPLIERREPVSIGDEWDYFKGNREVDEEWREVDFVPDDSWFAGPSGIGYGDGDDETILDDMENRYLTVYCRKNFEVANPGIVETLELSIDYDDGFVAYLNGAEVARSENMGLPGTPVGRNQRPDSSREAGEPEVFELSPGLLRAGVNVLAIEVHNNGSGSGDLSMIPRLEASYMLIGGNGAWRYLPGEEQLSGDWSEPGFDDSAWSRGPAGIGYGDGDDLTELADMRNRYVSVFCRKSFWIDCPAELSLAVLTAVYDDGLVLYLNGEELGRANMPGGSVSRNTTASRSVESAVASLDIDGGLFRQGENVLAVSVHNSSRDSSDLSFMLTLAPSLVSRPTCEEEPVGRPVLFRRGDVTAEGELDITDAVKILLSLFVGGFELLCPDAADVDDDGRLLVTDAVRLLGYLFSGDEPLPPPAFSCGEDPTPDELGACEGGGCEA